MKGFERFDYYLTQLDTFLQQAPQEQNPALYLYQHDARTKLFMLEGLSKLYSGLHDKKLFQKLEKGFKLPEDLLGAVDYYDAFAKDFLADPEMPSTIRMALEQRRDEKLAELNALLIKKKWLSVKRPRTKKIRKKLAKAGWKEPVKEIKLIRDFYEESINKIKDFFNSLNGKFTGLETQVHSLRRKLRWLSIYPQALQGAIQLADNDIPDPAVQKYLTPEIINSPFNKLPGQNDNEVVLLLEKNYFLALSYMIAALGKLKDAGLRVIAAAEGIEMTQFVNKEAAMQRAFELNKTGDSGLTDIMQKAMELCTPYFEEHMLERIIAATSYPTTEVLNTDHTEALDTLS